MLQAPLRHRCPRAQPVQSPCAGEGNGDAGSLPPPPTAPPECSAPLPPPTAADAEDDPSQEWRVVKIQRVLISPPIEPRKASLSRSCSLSEKELKEAKARSRRIVAQLTTAPGPSSKGVLLFHRRRQRVDGLAGHGTGLPLSTGTQPGAMEEGDGHGAQGMAPEPGHNGEGQRDDVAPQQEPPAEAQQLPLSVYLKENMALAASNGVHEVEKAESEVGGLQGRQDSLGTGVAAPVSLESVRIPEQKNGEVASAPVGTASISVGTASTSMGTASTSMATASTSVGTASISVGTASTSVATASTSVGTPSTSVGTANAPMVTPSTPMGMASTAMGTPSAPVGTASTPMVTASAPMVTASAPMGTASMPVGTASTHTVTTNIPMGTASTPMVTANAPIGMANVPMGTTSPPMMTTNIPTGTASTAMGMASTPTGTTSSAMVTTRVPMGMADAPMGTTSPAKVTTNVPMGTASTPMVTSNASMGTANAPTGTTSPPMVTANAPMEMVNASMRMASSPIGMASAPMGTSSPPMVTTSIPMVTANTPMVTATPAGQAQSGARGRQLYEVHLTLAKPQPVKNRTARPFGTQTPSQPPQPAPGTELPPPPTYAETLGSPPPLSRVRSPPAYSALYPPGEQKVLLGPGYRVGAVAPLPKTGILEESAARRSTKKPMFTFVEKPRLGPNPDLLDLVQSADSRKKQKEHGEPGAEDEPFALGAEAANFVPSSTARAAQPLPAAEDAPAWSSCLKSPTVQPKPKPQPSHNLSEARGKGAELFARRQSRMEKFIIEAPSQPELLRSPSPTMSLPPSWKYDACLSPMVSRHPSRSPSRPSKTPPASLYGHSLTESEVSRRELELSRQQPYQLQPSLFILSPSKAAASSVPHDVPPPRPSLPDTYSQLVSCPASPLPPSPVWQRLVLSPGAGTELLLASPCLGRSPRIRGGFQAPRPSYSTRNAGIEPQERRPSLPASPTRTPRPARPQGSRGGRASPAAPDEAPPGSPPWSDRSVSPPRGSRQMQARLARNIINAARRKSSSPSPAGPDGSRPFTPPAGGAPALPLGCRAPQGAPPRSVPGSPVPAYRPPPQPPLSEGPLPCAPPGAEGRRLLLPPGPARLSPAQRYSSRSPTDSDVSIDSEDSGTKSPSIHSFNLCPRGWSGSLRLKAGGLPSGAPCTS